jgi:hypothetical protein
MGIIFESEEGESRDGISTVVTQRRVDRSCYSSLFFFDEFAIVWTCIRLGYLGKF